MTYPARWAGSVLTAIYSRRSFHYNSLPFGKESSLYDVETHSGQETFGKLTTKSYWGFGVGHFKVAECGSKTNGTTSRMHVVASGVDAIRESSNVFRVQYTGLLNTV